MLIYGKLHYCTRLPHNHTSSFHGMMLCGRVGSKHAHLVAYALAHPDEARSLLLLSALPPPTFLFFWSGTCV